MASDVPCAVLHNGARLPLVGLGTWLGKDGEVQAAVIHALRSGYRHIDCAAIYGNEKEVGEGLAAAFEQGICQREDVWVTSKLWNTNHGKDHVEPALRKTLADLQLEYLDLFLIHWPQAYLHGEGNMPKHPSGEMKFSDTPLLETWGAMESVHAKGLARSIGLSNFNRQQVEHVTTGAVSVKPAVLQIESHPYLVNEALVSYALGEGLGVIAYCPLGAPTRPWAREGEPTLLEDAKLGEVARRLGRTVAQVLLRFQVQRGVAVIPKSVTPSRIEENLQAAAFTLAEEDMAYIRSFDRHWRSCRPTITLADGSTILRDAAHPNFPFADDPEPRLD